MYVVGADLAHVTVNAGTWSVATGLTPTADPRTFFAANAHILVESPILVGLRIGDTATFVVRAPASSAPRTILVPLTQYQRPVVRITPLPNPSEKQRRMREAWMRGEVANPRDRAAGVA